MAVKVLDKKSICSLVIFFAVQILMIYGFIAIAQDNKTVELQELNYIEITVKDIEYYNSIFKGVSRYRFAVHSDFGSYYFPDVSKQAEYSDREIYESISEGDTLKIGYIEENGLFGVKKWIIEAKNEDVKYRTLEQYNDGRKNGAVFVTVIIAVAETIWGFLLVVSLWLNGVFKRRSNKRKKLKNTQ